VCLAVCLVASTAELMDPQRVGATDRQTAAMKAVVTARRRAAVRAEQWVGTTAAGTDKRTVSLMAEQTAEQRDMKRAGYLVESLGSKKDAYLALWWVDLKDIWKAVLLAYNWAEKSAVLMVAWMVWKTVGK
jgi:hypothetical protein